MSVINTNVKSLVAQTAMAVNNRSLDKAMQSLSTGSRINSSADDAAGLAISSKMTAQIRGLDQAVRNANDGISMLQTADSSLVEVTNMVQRMRELAVQAASDTNVTTDRAAMDTEYAALRTETNRIISTTQWNGMNLLDGSVGNAGTVTLQVGANANQIIQQSISGLAAGASGTLLGTVLSGTNPALVSTTTFTGTPALGDTFSFTFGSKSFSYTAIAADVAGIASVNITAVIDKLALAATAAGFPQEGITMTKTGTTLVATGTAAYTQSILSSTGGLGAVAGTSLTTQALATAAITATDTSIALINSKRADLGATVNRLTYAADNLANVSQNTSASRSRVLDTDYAKATTELSRTQILQQASTAMLAQANQSAQSVLALLK